MGAPFTWLANGWASLSAALSAESAGGDVGPAMTSTVEPGVWFLLALLLVVQIGFAVFFFLRFRRRPPGARDPSPRPRLRLVASRSGPLRSRGSRAGRRRLGPPGSRMSLARRNRR